LIESFNHLIEAAFAGIESSINVASPAGLMLLGLLTGLRHSMEADHVAAVSTIVAGSKKFGRASLLGAMWGLGHTASLFAAGLVVLLLAVNIPAGIAGTLEFGVGIMLVFLGATALTGFSAGRFFRGLLGKSHTHVHVHRETGIVHSHEHSHAENHRHGHKSVIVGMVHGMAGSGALMLVVLSSINSVPLGLAYIMIFGTGSTASMAAISALIGLPFAKARSQKLSAALKYAAAIVTLAVGAGLMWQLAANQFWQ
jgi:high-affinity nickel permease